MRLLGNELPEEVRELSERLEFNPGDVETRERLGNDLIELGEFRPGVAHLCLAAEIHAEREGFPNAISLLTRVLEIDPDNARARRLLPTFYSRVPRTPSARHRTLGPASNGFNDHDDEYGAALFSLPEESAAALAQLLPFADEDVDAPRGRIHVPLPIPAHNGKGRALYAALDRELRRASRTGIDIPPALQSERNGDTAPYASLNITRIKPAASVVSLDDLPPNQIVGLLDTEPLRALLDRVDAISVDGDKLATVGARTGVRALFVIVRGTFEVRRHIGDKTVPVDTLHPGDFFGEAEVLTTAVGDSEFFAETDGMLLELPARVMDEIAVRRPEVRELLWDAYFTRSFRAMMTTSALFSRLPPDALARVAVELEPLVFQTGDIVLRAGDPPEGLYCVVGGSIAVLDTVEEPATLVTRLAAGTYFGGFPSDAFDASPTTVIATEASTLLWLSPFALASLLVSLPELGTMLADAKRGSVWPYQRIA